MEDDNNSDCNSEYSLNSNTPRYGEYCSFYDTKNEIDKVAFNGRCFVYEKADRFFKVKGYKSKILINPTYRDLIKIADELIKCTKDYHHIFFEGISVVKKIHSNLYKIRIDLGS